MTRLLTRCEEIMRKVCEDFEAELKEFTGRINRAIMHRHLWSPSCVSASCGEAPLAIVRQYIEQQKRPLEGAGQSSPEMHSSPA